MTGKGPVCRGRLAEPLARTRKVVIEGGEVCAFSVPSAAVARPNGIRKQRGFERRAHECSRRVWEVRGARGRIGQHVPILQSSAPHLLLEFGLDHVQALVHQVMFRFELG